MAAPEISVIVPAYNEAAVLHRSLSPLAAPAATGQLQVIVVANGCVDGTAARAAELCPAATVIDTAKAGKTAALNLGAAVARGRAVLCLDADLSLSYDALIQLALPILCGEADAVCGSMEVDTDGSSRAVSAFYKAWALNPYHDGGKFGGVFGLSARMKSRLFPLPTVASDDEFVARQLSSRRVAHVPEARFTVHAPQRLGDLIRIRTRVRRGTRALERAGHTTPRPTNLSAFGCMARRALSQPKLWPCLAVYAAVTLAVRVRLALRPGAPMAWERDDSSRQTQVTA